MLPKIVTRRAEQVRLLLSRGVFAGARVPLRNGGTLPAELFAEIALSDLNRLLVSGAHGDGEASVMSWRRLAEDIELLHEVALAREYAEAEQRRVRA